MLQKPQNFSALECAFQNTEKECCITTSYQKDKKLNWYQCFVFFKVVLNILENAQSLPWLQCVPVILRTPVVGKLLRWLPRFPTPLVFMPYIIPGMVNVMDFTPMLMLYYMARLILR